MKVGLNQRVFWALIAAALSMVALVVFPAMVEAQEKEEYDAYTVYTKTAQNDADQSDDDAEEAAVATPGQQQATHEPAARLVVEPGDSLWSISRARLGPAATPGQIADEVERTYRLNRALIGDDPNLILPGQELLVPPPVAEPVAEGQTPESTSEPAAPDESSGMRAAPTPSSEAVKPLPSPNAKEHWVLGLGRAHWLLGVGILLLASILTLFLAWRALDVRRSLKRDPRPPGFERSLNGFEDTATAENGALGRAEIPIADPARHKKARRVGISGTASGRRTAALSVRESASRRSLRKERQTAMRGRRVRRLPRYAPSSSVPLRGAVATNERATEANLEVPRLSAKRKRKMRAASLAGPFARSEWVVAKGEQGLRGGPRKDLQDLKKAGE